ncbi:MAG: hypothetical protein NTZ19_07375 [Bacteroidetes bacterium]|nr:hypothetical protein [Bacteroidota bacterium]
MSFRLFYWLRISLFNLLLVAIIGLVLRYKIAFSLPFIDQKHLLHGHSHFAFTGWISMALMAFMVDYVGRKKEIDLFPKYNWLLWGNLITAYGMLLSFPFQGYGIFSISFSTLSIFVSWIFTIQFWKELNGIKHNAIISYWFKAGLLFNAISALGAFSLAAMMANKIVHQNWYLLAVYFFLHFQYNGWFFFTCMGLFFDKAKNAIPYLKKQKQIFWIFATTCIPAYFLSALWLNMPIWAYCIIVIAAILQLYAWGILLKQVFPKYKDLSLQYAKPANWLLLFSGIALTIKFVLQATSTIPSISTLAFGFRPIVIAYLHLILLGVITIFILANILSSQVIIFNKKVLIGIFVFVFAIIFNECLLMTQGIAAILETSLEYINELLLAAAILLVSGILLLNLGIKFRN